MSKVSKFFDEKPGTSFAIVASIILFIGVLIFLFTKDNAANPNSITGWEVLGQQSFSFWLWAAFFSLLAGGVVAFLSKYFRADGDSKSFGVAWIVIGAFLAIAWGKGCTDKANDGVTAPQGRPDAVQIDTTRVPAEDLLPKQ